MVAADYTTTDDVLDYLGAATFDQTNDLPLLAEFVTAHSRMVDRETGKPPGFWASQTVTRKYSGDGSMDLEIDPFDTITSVTVSSALDRADAVTLQSVTPDYYDFYVPYPLTGPPWMRLHRPNFYWYPDVYGIGNVWVTGTDVIPPELVMAVNIWIAHTWKRKNANWADKVAAPERPTQIFVGKPPDDVLRILEYFQGEEERLWFV